MEIQKAGGRDLSTPMRDKSIATKDFKEVLQNIAFDIGIRQALTSIDLDVIFIFLNKNFGWINLNGLIEAFDLYSAQNLRFKENHFNSFDKLFIGKVLNSYKEYKEDREKRRKITPSYDYQEKYIWSYNEKRNHFNWLVDVYINSEYGNPYTFPDILIASFKDIYELLITDELIEKPSDKELQEKIIRAKSIDRSSKLNRGLSLGINDAVNKSNIPTCFYRMEVMDYIKKNYKQ